MENPVDSGSRRAFLPEVEGLRAIAVSVVLLFHAKLGFSGGYVGVDVFFVVSGFLITGLLIRELESSGTIRLREFYARRARRLLPAATLVLIATLVLARALLDRPRVHETAVDVTWAAGFLANFHFAIQGADYFRRGADPSLVQHWWSLAVEEQFYLVWPMALLGLVWLGKRVTRRRAVRSVLIVPAIAVTTGGFFVGRWLTSSKPSWGYFATWSRGWELALGAVVAIVWNRQRRLLDDRVRAAAAGIGGWLGLGAVIFSAIHFDGRTPFPGTAALAPLLGTVAVLASIGAPLGPGRILSLAPMQWIGGRSYGIYLWHWPLLLLVTARMDHPGPWLRAAVLVGSVVLAALTYSLFENPIRHHRMFASRPLRSLGIGAALVATTLVAGSAVAAAVARSAPRTGYVAESLSSTTTSKTTSPTSSEASAGTGTSSTAPPVTGQPDAAVVLLAELDRRVRTELAPILQRSVENEQLPDNLEPPLPQVMNDGARQLERGCLAGDDAVDNAACVFGDPDGTLTIAILGDSHSVEWFPALDLVGRDRHWKVAVFAKRGCPAATVTIRTPDQRVYRSCDEWRRRALDRLVKERVQLVITSNFADFYSINERRLTPEAWQQGMTATANALRAGGVKLLVISDTPIPRSGPSSCLDWNRHHISKCNVPRPASAFTEVERSGATSGGWYFYDSRSWFCNDECPLVIGNLAVYFDLYHVTATYGRFLAPYLDLLIRGVMASPTPGPLQ